MTNHQLQIKQFIFGPFETNTYVVSINDQSPMSNDQSPMVLLIDPACSNDWEQQELLRYINGLSVNRSVSPEDGLSAQRSVSETVCQRSGLTIIATHGHLDHLWGAKWATEQWHTPVLMHEADIPMAKAMQQQYNLFGIRAKAQDFPIEPITNHQLPITNVSILSTPGHTPGSICLYFPQSSTVNCQLSTINCQQSPITNHQSPILLSGDTLFRMGYGRTDLPGGNIGQLIDSLEHLFTLPSDTLVYPGHGDSTTIGAERR